MNNDYTPRCARCKCAAPEDYVVVTLTENFCRAEPYSRMTSVKESEAKFCTECAQAVSAVFWGQA